MHADVRSLNTSGLILIGLNLSENIMIGASLLFDSNFQFVYLESQSSYYFGAVHSMRKRFFGRGYKQNELDNTIFSFYVNRFDGKNLTLQANRIDRVYSMWETNLTLYYQVSNISAGYYAVNETYYKCPAGYFCPGGTVNETLYSCPQGYFCPEGASVPTACPDGTYGAQSNFTDISNCTACAPGYYCDAASTTSVQHVCPPGFYCPFGVKLECNPGFFA